MSEIYNKIVKGEFLSNEDLDMLGEHALCYSALTYASKHKTVEAKRILEEIDKSEPDHSCAIFLEAKSLVYFSLREFNAAKEFSSLAIKKESHSYFAYFVSARIAIFEKKFFESAELYKVILEHYPERERIVLDIAEAYLLGKKTEAAVQYINISKQPLRQKLYKLYLLLRKFRIRLLWLLIIFGLYTNIYLLVFAYILSTVFLMYLFFQWGQRQGDIVVLRLSVYLQLFNSVFFLPAACSILNNFFVK